MYGIQADVFQTGKVNISDTSQNNHGCQTVSFNTQLQGSGDVKAVSYTHLTLPTSDLV